MLSRLLIFSAAGIALTAGVLSLSARPPQALSLNKLTLQSKQLSFPKQFLNASPFSEYRQGTVVTHVSQVQTKGKLQLPSQMREFVIKSYDASKLSTIPFKTSTPKFTLPTTLLPK